MKRFWILLLLIAFVPQAQIYGQGLDSIQGRIEKSFLDFRSGNKNGIKLILSDLRSIKAAKGKAASSYINYWLGFALYRYSIAVALNDEKQAEILVEEGIEVLEEIGKKNSEHYALLSLMKGFALRFANPLMLPIAAPKVGELAKKAIALNPENPRAHLALGSYDFYTPTMFGGGKIAEEELLISVKLPQNYDPNPYAPTWGLRNAYRLLISLYDTRKDREQTFKYSLAMIDAGFQESVAYNKIIGYHLSKGDEQNVEKYSLSALSAPVNPSDKELFHKHLINHYIRVNEQEKTKIASREALKQFPGLLSWLKERPLKFPEQAGWLQFVNDLN